MRKSNNKYDLGERTFKFAKNCRDFVKKLPKTITNIEYTKQLSRSSGSVAANWIEANESLSKKDFGHRNRICRKEAKESHLWLRLSEVGSDEALAKKQATLIKESYELTKIFGSMVEKSK